MGNWALRIGPKNANWLTEMASSSRDAALLLSITCAGYQQKIQAEPTNLWPEQKQNKNKICI